MGLISGSALNIELSVTGRIAAAAAIGSADQDLNLSVLEQLLAGTGAGEIDTVYEEAVDLAASATETHALVGGSLLDPFGETVAFAHVKAILLICAAGGGGLIFGDPASDGAALFFGATTHTLQVDSGEMFLLTAGATEAGWAITASTAMNVKLANASSSLVAKGTLLIVGTST